MSIMTPTVKVHPSWEDTDGFNNVSFSLYLLVSWLKCDRVKDRFTVVGGWTSLDAPLNLQDLNTAGLVHLCFH